MSKISIMMPVYNEKISWVEQSIESILNQSYKDLELIIVLDNPQNDELRSVLEDFCSNHSKIKLLINDENLGIVKSLNKAITYSDGEYIARMDSDDISFVDRLEKEINFLVNNNLDMVTSTVLEVDETGELIISRAESDIVGKNFEHQIKYRTLGAHPTWLGKKDLFLKLGGYRNISFAEDLDFILRAIEQKFTIGLMGTPSLKYRIRSNSITSLNQLDMFKTTIYLRRLFARRVLSTTDSHEIIKQLESIDDQDREKYQQISQFRKNIFYLVRTNKMLALVQLPKYIIYAMNNKYTRQLLIEDARRILKK